MSRIIVFDPASGASGDMILGALLDAGAPLAAMQEAVSRLGIAGVRIGSEAVSSGAVRGARVTIDAAPDQPARDWQGIQRLLMDSALAVPVREAALAVFQALAEAEAQAHNEPVERVHFHEVGAVDAIVDVVGACAGLAALGGQRVVSYPVAVGAGWITASHGVMPVPAPATANLLAAKQIPIRPNPPGTDTPGELLTPTGAAILGVLAEWQAPAFTPLRGGYGFGTKQLPWPNALRAWVGEVDDEADAGSEYLLETNIDDMNPQFFELLTERLFAAGALDVWLSGATMKKGRPATVVSAIAPAGRREAIERTLILESTTIGIRATPISRTRAPRAFRSVTTRWGDVRLKLRGWDGRVLSAAPEYDDCLALSRERSVPVREVWAEANRLGEVYAGQRWEEIARNNP
ncbi:MAG: nickel pincer cofactor biosynthesis protein LarC [Thermomicrobiales bacterium]|nr:nickel pincer cofactor biosynthesis protein LarC [Thermomicrobiales bacterium]